MIKRNNVLGDVWNDVMLQSGYDDLISGLKHVGHLWWNLFDNDVCGLQKVGQPGNVDPPCPMTPTVVV